MKSTLLSFSLATLSFASLASAHPGCGGGGGGSHGPSSGPTISRPMQAQKLDVQAARAALARPLVSPASGVVRHSVGNLPLQQSPGVPSVNGIVAPPSGNGTQAAKSVGIDSGSKAAKEGAPSSSKSYQVVYTDDANLPPGSDKNFAAGKTGAPERPKGREIQRKYDSKGVVLITREGGEVEEAPFLVIPLLFRNSSDLLVDQISRENVRRLAEAINSITDDGAQFIIEGHAARGFGQFPKGDVSLFRAEAIQRLLVDAYNVDEKKLSVAGMGTSYANHPEGAPEEQLNEDRRVIVVRVK